MGTNTLLVNLNICFNSTFLKVYNLLVISFTDILLTEAVYSFAADVSVPARPSPRDSSYSAVQMTLPECYQSEEVLRLQREKEERFKSLQYYDKKIKEAVEKEKLRQSMIQVGWNLSQCFTY